MFCQTVFCFQIDNSHFGNLHITLEIKIMAQAKLNRELASLGADLMSTDASEGYIACSKLKINSASQGTGENNVPLLQTMTSDDNEEALTGTSTAWSLLSSPTDNSTSENLSQSSMKCYFHHKHHHFLDYSNDPIVDDAVIYTSDIPFQYNKIEGRYTEFVGNPKGTVFIAAKRDHKFY